MDNIRISQAPKTRLKLQRIYHVRQLLRITNVVQNRFRLRLFTVAFIFETIIKLRYVVPNNSLEPIFIATSIFLLSLSYAFYVVCPNISKRQRYARFLYNVNDYTVSRQGPTKIKINQMARHTEINILVILIFKRANKKEGNCYGSYGGPKIVFEKRR